MKSISGFVNGNYEYDVNGNMISDGSKSISIGYNYLNLPESVTKAGEQMQNTWLANGTKLKKTVGGLTREYAGGIEYNNGTVEFIQTEEGRARPNGNNYFYEYMLKDYLGNTRLMFDQNGTVLESSDYYPLGLQVARAGNTVPSPENRYKYNGKELQTELGLMQYDYGARFYDPVIGRWNVIDPLAEKTISDSPYIYGANNPTSMVDNDGRYAVSVHYNITYKALLALGYSKKEADLMAHYSSTYADHPSVTVLNFDYLLHGGSKDPQKHNYRNGINYSLTTESQSESNSRWHSMMSDAEAAGGMHQIEALARGLKFGWDNIFASEGGKNLKKYGQGMHALQDAIAYKGRRTEDHLGFNLPSVGAMYQDMYGSTKEAENLTRSAGILVRLMAGKEVKFRNEEELDFQGTSAGQLSQIIGLLMNAGFHGTINFR